MKKLIQRRSSKGWKFDILILGVIISYTFFPLICATLAFGIANICGCELGGADVTSCFVCGQDIGAYIDLIILFGWIPSLFTVPSGLIAIVGYIIYIIFKYTEKKVR